MHCLKVFIRWLKGDYPLSFTYWITAILPSMMMGLFFYTLNYQMLHATIDIDIAGYLSLLVMLLYIIYTPLSLCAVFCSAVKYNGLILWKILALIIVARGVFYYFQIIVGIVF